MKVSSESFSNSENHETVEQGHGRIDKRNMEELEKLAAKVSIHSPLVEDWNTVDHESIHVQPYTNLMRSHVVFVLEAIGGDTHSLYKVLTTRRF